MSLGSNKARLDVSKCSTSSEDLDGLRSQVCWWTRLTTEKSQPFLYYILYLSSQPSEPRTFHPSFQVIERFASLQEEPLQRGSAFRRSPSIARFNKVYTGGHGCRFLWIKWLMCYIYIYLFKINYWTWNSKTSLEKPHVRARLTAPMLWSKHAGRSCKESDCLWLPIMLTMAC